MRCMVGAHFLVYFVRQTGASFSYLFEKKITVFSRLSGFIITSSNTIIF